MSPENVATIQRVYDAFNRHDLDQAVQQLHADFELYPALVGPGQRSQYLGRDGAREFFELITDVWEMMAVEAERIIEFPDGRILAVENWRVRGRDGIEIDTELTDLTHFETV
jgi:ketosteroid isomerase-like protein